MRFLKRAMVAGAALAILAVPAAVRGEEIPKEYRETVRKGLEYIAKSQNKAGYWEGAGGTHRISMTALAATALLCEGSTMREGKYRDNIRRAVQYLMDKQQPNGLFSNPGDANEHGRYMYGHGYAVMFLACIVGEEDNAKRREKLVQVLEKACKYSSDAQTKRGGWGYVSAKDGSDFDEGSVTITQMQGLRAARNAGIIVPNKAIKDGVEYLRLSTTDNGGVQYSLAFGGGGRGDGRPALTAAAICCGFSAGEYNGDLVKKWLKFCQGHLNTPGDGRRMGHDEYTHYYFAQVVYVLGDDRFKKLFPDAKGDDLITWTKYRKSYFDAAKASQSADGSWSADTWTARMVGPIYVTAVNMAIMQLDKGAVPIYQR
ncbi:MAG: terpene cyclase/mutase family protein [Gemmataceae bacterium]|nr:terpene cyclase/mutase family protein [Gemmataceae bacterium]